MGLKGQGRGARTATLVAAAIFMAAAAGGTLAAPRQARAASVEGDTGPMSDRAEPAPPRSAEPRSAWSGDLEELLKTAGFDDAVLLSGAELKRLGDRLTAGWIASDGDLFGLLYVVPADEPGVTMRAFVDQVGRSCPGTFHGGVDALDAIKDRSVGRAAATCQEANKALHYDMIFYFTPDGTVGISHIGFDADLERVRKINNGLSDIFRGL